MAGDAYAHSLSSFVPGTGTNTGISSQFSGSSGGGGGVPDRGTASLSYFGARKLLRTLSTVSIHESGEGVTGGLAAMGPIGQAIMERKETAADGPASEMPADFEQGIEGEGESDRAFRGLRVDRERESASADGAGAPGLGKREEVLTMGAGQAGKKEEKVNTPTPKSSTPNSAREKEGPASAGGSGSGSGTPSSKKKEKRFIIF